MLESQKAEPTDEFGVPDIEFPTLNFSDGLVTLDDFVPTDAESYSNLDLVGSFTIDSIESPDLAADGTNWVHSTILQWTSDDLWIYSETLVMVFNESDSFSDSADLSDSDDEEEDPADGGPALDGSVDGDGGGSEEEESDYETYGSWQAEGSATRFGFVIITFTASRGYLSPAAAGTAWSLSYAVSDNISIAVSASGGGGFRPRESGEEPGGFDPLIGEGEGTGPGSGDDAGGLDGDGSGGTGDGGTGGDDASFEGSPWWNEFSGDVTWSASASISAYLNGSASFSSTPGLLEVEDAEPGTPPIITRSVDSTGSSAVGGNEAYASSWSGGVSAGNLVPPENWGYVVDGNNPLPPGGRLGGNDGGKPGSDDGYGDALRDNWGEGGGGELPPSPLGGFEGSGMAVAASASGSLNAGGEATGSWSMNGILHDDKWASLVGSALDAFNASTSSSGDDSGLIVLRDSGVEETETSTTNWSWTLGYSSGANGGDGASIGGSVTTELSPTDEGLAEVDYTDAWVRLAADADGDVKTNFSLGISQSFVENLTQTTDATEPLWLRGESVGGRSGSGSLTFQYGESANFKGDGLSEVLGIDATPTAEANLEWKGTQGEYISLDTSGNYGVQYDEYDMYGDHMRDTLSTSNETFLIQLGNLVTNDGDLHGTLSFVAATDENGEDEADEYDDDEENGGDEGEEELVAQVSWSGEAGSKAASKVNYHATLVSDGHEKMWSEGDWITLYDADEDRDATFELLAIEQQSFDPVTGEFGDWALTLIGDQEVQITGTDLYDQPWELNELEVALTVMAQHDHESEDEDGDQNALYDEGDGSGEGTGVGDSGQDEGERTSMGGWNPWASNVPFGQHKLIGWLSGGWTATSRANELARQERAFRRQQAINDPGSQYAIEMQQTYRATPGELRRMTELAETGIEANAAILGGSLLSNGFCTRFGTYVRKVDGYKHALDVEHVNAALVEKGGGGKISPKNGLPYDHLLETRNAINGLYDRIPLLKKYLSDPNLTPAQRSAIEGELSEISLLLDRAEEILGERSGSVR